MRDGIRRQFTLALAMGVSLALWSGCSRDARLADRKLRHPEIKTVTHYGVALDKNALPKQVAYVLLRAIRDDFLANTDEERQRALDIQFDLCAAGEIEKANPTSLARDEYIYEVVHRWTPTVSHYVHDFETEWEKTDARLATSRPRTATGVATNTNQRQVLMQVNDQSGDPNARAVLVVSLVQDKGYWRVLGLWFDPYRRSIKSRASIAGESSEAPSTSGD